jgi:hypothetical protein
MNLEFSHRKLLIASAAALALSTIFGLAAYAQTTPGATVPVNVIVTVTGKDGQEPPALQKEDFLVFQGNDRRRVISAVPQTGEANKLDLYVVVDENSEAQLSLHYPEISAFLRELPGPAMVGVAYARNGVVTIAHDLTTDREAAIKALRIPLGRLGATGGIYLSMADLAKRTNPALGRRAAILLLSHGIDTFRGIRETAPGVNPDLDTAIAAAQRKGIVIYSIYVAPSSHFYRSFFLVNNGQSCLARLGDETGGEAYFTGTITPLNMQPFLDEMARHLAHQYLLTFEAKPGKKPGLYGIRVRVEVSGAEVDAPSAVFIPLP